MGKIKRPRSRPAPDVAPEELIEDELEIGAGSSQENLVQTMLDQLQAPNVEEKYCGLQTLSMLSEEASRLEAVLDNGVVRSAAPLLLDSAGAVRGAAAGALRNISALGLQACEHLIEHDVCTPLLAYFHEHAESWVPKPGAKKLDEDSETFVHCVNLLWNLCENSGIAIKYFNDSNILNILVRCLDLATFGNEIVVSILQCLFVVTEDNIKATEKIQALCEDKLRNLLQLVGNEPPTLLIRTLSAGVIINSCGGSITSLPPETINKIMSILAETLSVDHRLACSQLSSNIPLSDGRKKPKAPKGKEGQVLENQIKSVTQLLDAQQSSVEIIANLCSCEDSDDSVEADESSDNEDLVEEEMLDCSGNNESVFPVEKLPPEVTEGLASYKIFEKVWARTMLPAENVLLILKEYENSLSIYNKLRNLQSRSLLCTNNILSSLPLDTLGGTLGVYRIWVDTGKLVFQQTSSDNITLLESATAVMRAALDRIKSNECGSVSSPGENMFNDLSLADIEMMVTGIRECQVPEIRSNLIRMIGTLALLLTSNLTDTATDVVALITEFILDQAHKESEAWVLAEALDTLLDLYSEDETDALAARTRLVDRLASLAPILNSKARQQRKSLGERSVLVRTAVSNLPRFIKYKRARVAKLKS